MNKGTKLIHSGRSMDPFTGAASVPIYQTSLFHQESLERPGKYDYARSGNPTREALEEIIAALEEGAAGFAFASGMAAISSVFLLFSQGDHLIVSADVYGGTYRVLTRLFSRLGLEVSFVDTTRLEEIASAVKKNTRALFLETPSNPLLKITDLAGAVSLAKKHHLLTIVDNTFMTPYWQRPLELGADIVVHSATKYLGGHSDLIAGLAVARDKGVADEIKFIQNAFGAVLGPQDCWLVMRGIKTLKVRLEQHQQGAFVIARWLKEHPLVREVYYPGLEDHPGHELHKRQASGFGGIVSFRLKTAELARQLLEKVKLPLRGASLGAVESIISWPAGMSHASLPPEIKDASGITPELIRLSVGLEDPLDLMEDLRQALEKA